MAANMHKVMLPHTMGAQGIALVRSRDDIETVIYPTGIAPADPPVPPAPSIASCAGRSRDRTTIWSSRRTNARSFSPRECRCFPNLPRRRLLCSECDTRMRRRS